MLNHPYHTKTSELISQFIHSRNEHGFTAVELSDFLRAHGMEVNKTTVYRNLDKLTETGVLVKRKSALNDGYIYQNQTEEGHCADHIHFQCEKCGSVIHLSDENTSAYIKSISEALGLQIDLSASSLNGICSKCREEIKK